jgi:UDP-glucuronate 4-epimerase
MKIVVTGHAGFIGRHLYQHLISQGHEVIGLDIKTGNDIRTCTLPEADVVIHLAARAGVRASIKMPDDYWIDNVDATHRLFDHYSRTGTYIMYASSSSAKRWWLNPYATTKKVVEQLAPPRSLGMRFHTVYGLDSRPDMLYDMILNRTVYYRTDHVRDFTHVDDIVAGIMTLLQYGYVGVVDIGTGNPVPVSSLLDAAGINVPVLKFGYEAEETCADPIELIDLGWRPTKNIIEELQKDIVLKKHNTN